MVYLICCLLVTAFSGKIFQIQIKIIWQFTGNKTLWWCDTYSLWLSRTLILTALHQSNSDSSALILFRQVMRQAKHHFLKAIRASYFRERDPFTVISSYSAPWLAGCCGYNKEIWNSCNKHSTKCNSEK